MQTGSHKGSALWKLDARPRYHSKGNWWHQGVSSMGPVPVIGMHAEVCASQTELSSSPPGPGMNTDDDMRQPSSHKQPRSVQEAMPQEALITMWAAHTSSVRLMPNHVSHERVSVNTGVTRWTNLTD